MAGLAAITLLWRGTPLDRLWVLNQVAYNSLVPMGRAVGILFLLLSGGPHHGRNRVVPTPPLGMETRSCNHRHAGCGGSR
jgi:hypothetical protein